jgi:redox-sensitive bicupin YhaK (pirin superfamily)
MAGHVRRPVAQLIRRPALQQPLLRLMSPSDLGVLLKPFVFLDLFEVSPAMIANMPLHPHSGIATVTVVIDGEMAFAGPAASSGVLRHGGVEWMRAGGGVWHGKDLVGLGDAPIRGFQLWLSLPPELENGEVDAQYLQDDAIPSIGPARLILGQYGDVRSPVRSPAGINYLLVSLAAGERWAYSPPPGHDTAWLAVGRGNIECGASCEVGDLAIFGSGGGAIMIENLSPEDARFVLGSAVPSSHPLHLGYHSVHTSPEALARGEQRLRDTHPARSAPH